MTDSIKLLTESLNPKITNVKYIQLLNESDGQLPMIEFAASILDKETGNGRIYTSEVVKMALVNANEDLINETLLCTANGHPVDASPEPIDSSHVITKAWVDNSTLWCQAKILKTIAGQDLTALIEAGVGIGVSIRGTGSQNGMYVSNYTFKGADFVGVPSTGLRVKPELINHKINIGENLTKSQPTLYMEEQGVIMSQQNTMTSVSIVEDLLKESISNVKKARNQTEASSIVAMTETKLSQINGIDASSSLLGMSKYNNLLKEWDDAKYSIIDGLGKDNIKSPDMYCQKGLEKEMPKQAEEEDEEEERMRHKRHSRHMRDEEEEEESHHSRMEEEEEEHRHRRHHMKREEEEERMHRHPRIRREEEEEEMRHRRMKEESRHMSKHPRMRDEEEARRRHHMRDMESDRQNKDSMQMKDAMKESSLLKAERSKRIKLESDLRKQNLLLIKESLKTKGLMTMKNSRESRLLKENLLLQKQLSKQSAMIKEALEERVKYMKESAAYKYTAIEAYMKLDEMNKETPQQ